MLDNGTIASGGTDLFALGRQTFIGHTPFIGVHSWDVGWDGNDQGTARDIRFDENHQEHQKYIQYFQDIGFTPEKAKTFYFFTIPASRADNIHKMTKQEINTYLSS